MNGINYLVQINLICKERHSTVQSSATRELRATSCRQRMKKVDQNEKLHALKPILDSDCTLLLHFPVASRFHFQRCRFQNPRRINHANGICTIENVKREFIQVEFVLSSNRTSLRLCQKLSRGAYLNIRIVLIKDETSCILIWRPTQAQRLGQGRPQLQL